MGLLGKIFGESKRTQAYNIQKKQLVLDERFLRVEEKNRDDIILAQQGIDASADKSAMWSSIGNSVGKLGSSVSGSLSLSGFLGGGGQDSEGDSVKSIKSVFDSEGNSTTTVGGFDIGGNVGILLVAAVIFIVLIFKR